MYLQETYRHTGTHYALYLCIDRQISGVKYNKNCTAPLEYCFASRKNILPEEHLHPTQKNEKQRGGMKKSLLARRPSCGGILVCSPGQVRFTREWIISRYMDMWAVNAELPYASCFGPVFILHKFHQHSAHMVFLRSSVFLSEDMLSPFLY